MSILKRTFGCEFEFSTPFDDVKEIVKPIIDKIYGSNKIKIRKQHFLSGRNQKWHLKIDSSTECELVTPVSTIKDLPKILKVIKILHKKDLKITDSDAFHIHISANDVPMENIIIAWLFIEHCIVKCFDKSRQNNSFCPQLSSCKGKNTIIAEKYNNAIETSIEHHAIISMNYYHKRKTVEFRASQATFDTCFIEGWILFCFYFMNFAKRINAVEYMTKPINKLKYPREIIRELGIRNKKVEKFIAKN